MEDTYASLVSTFILESENELTEEELDDVETEEDFYDFIPFQQEFLLPLRDRAFSWDISLEDGLHGENFHNLQSSANEHGNPKLVIKAKRMALANKSEPAAAVTVKADPKKGAGNGKAGSGAKKKSDGESSGKGESPPNKSAASNSAPLPMKPPTKPPSHSNSSSNLKNAANVKPLAESVKAEQQKLSVSSLEASANQYMKHLQQPRSGSESSGGEADNIFNYVGEASDDHLFDHSVRNLERIMMAPEGGDGSGKGGQQLMSGGESGQQLPYPSSPHGSSAASASQNIMNGTPSGATDGYAKSLTSLALNSTQVGQSGMSGYSSSVADSSGSKASTPHSVHQHSTNPYSPYTPAVPSINGMVGATPSSSSSGAMGLLGSSSGIAMSSGGLLMGGLHNTIMPSNNPNAEFRVGAYTKEERQMKIDLFRAKKRKRIWRKQIKYDCRKRLADTRPRVKGRFVSRKLGDNDDIAALLGGGMLDDEMDGGMPMMDPSGMMMLGGPGMMMMGQRQGVNGQRLSKKQMKNELQALQIQQRYAAAVYGAGADPSMMYGMGADPQQLMFMTGQGLDYMGGPAAGMMGLMVSDGMAGPQLQSLMGFNGSTFGTAGATGDQNGSGPLLQHSDMFLTTEQMLIQQQQILHQQHMMQQQLLYRDSLNNLGSSSGGNTGVVGGIPSMSSNGFIATMNASAMSSGAMDSAVPAVKEEGSASTVQVKNEPTDAGAQTAAELSSRLGEGGGGQIC